MEAVGGLSDCSDKSQHWRANSSRNSPGCRRETRSLKNLKCCSIKCDSLDSGTIFLDNFDIRTKRCITFHFLQKAYKTSALFVWTAYLFGLGSSLELRLTEPDEGKPVCQVTLLDLLCTMGEVCPTARDTCTHLH